MKLTNLFSPTPLTHLVEFFLRHPRAVLSLTEVAGKTKLSIGSVYTHCHALHRQGILRQERKGKGTYYSLERENRTVRDLKRLHNLISDPVEKLIAAMEAEGVQKLVLFGSSARGEDDEDSDMDVLVVGDLNPESALTIANHLSRRFKRRFSIIVRTYEAYLAMPEKENTLWNKIQKEGVVIYEP